MPITQIPFQDPVAPPEKPQPEQLGLYDSQDWDAPDPEPESNVPHLLIQLQDDLTRSRRREAAWLSIIAHLVLIILIWNVIPIRNWIWKFLPWKPLVVVSQKDLTKDKNLTYLTLPPDAQKLVQKPNTKILSDKNRAAMTRHPQLDARELRKALASPPPGMPGLPGPKTAQPAPQAPPAVAQNQTPQTQQGQTQQRPPSDPNVQARLQVPAKPTNPFAKYSSPMSAGSAVEQAAEAAAAARASGQGGQGGYFGDERDTRGRPQGSLEVLSDTLGVDFAPYLERVRLEIYKHWYEVLPESVMPPTYKKGRLMIRFGILPDGRVGGLSLVATSGDTALDRAAWGGITGSDPFPPLPPEYIKAGGQYLDLKCVFSYNLQEKDLQ